MRYLILNEGAEPKNGDEVEIQDFKSKQKIRGILHDKSSVAQAPENYFRYVIITAIDKHGPQYRNVYSDKPVKVITPYSREKEDEIFGKYRTKK